MGAEQSQNQHQQPFIFQQKEDYKSVINQLGLLLAATEKWSFFIEKNKVQRIKPKFQEFYTLVETNSRKDFAKAKLEEFKQIKASYKAKYNFEPSLPDDFSSTDLQNFIDAHRKYTTVGKDFLKFLCQIEILFVSQNTEFQNPQRTTARQNISIVPVTSNSTNKKKRQRRNRTRKNKYGESEESNFENYSRPIEIKYY